MMMSTKSSLWLVCAGIVFLIAGIVVLAYPGITIASLAVILGIAILCTGLLQLAAFVGNTQEERGWVLLSGILDTIIGIFLLFNIIPTAMALPFVVGFWAMFTSISRIASAFSVKKLGFKNWGVLLITGILGFILSCLIIYYPVLGALFIMVYISVFLIFLGIMSISEAYLVKKANV